MTVNELISNLTRYRDELKQEHNVDIGEWSIEMWTNDGNEPIGTITTSRSGDEVVYLELAYPDPMAATH